MASDNEVVIIVKARNATKGEFDKARKDAKDAGKKIGDDLDKGIKDGVKKGSESEHVKKAGDKIGDTISDRVTHKLKDGAADAAVKEAGEKVGQAYADSMTKKINQRMKENVSSMRYSIPVVPGRDTTSTSTHTEKVKVKVEVDEKERSSFISRLASWGREGGAKLGQQLGDGITRAFANQDSRIVAGVATGLAVLSPMLGGAIATAVVGGAGAGGVLGGVFIAAKDARVKSAGKELGRNLWGDLVKEASVFVEPVLGVIDMIERRFERLGGVISNIFDQAATFVAPLADGLMRMIEGLAVGLDQAFGNAGPMIQALADGFASLGATVGQALVIMSGDAENSAAAFTHFFDVINRLVIGVAILVRGLSELYGWYRSLNEISNANMGVLGQLLGLQERGAGSTHNFAGRVRELSTATARASSSMADYVAYAAQVVTANQNLYSSTTNAAQAIADATAKIRENGRGLELNTQRGRDNRTALSNLAAALSRNYDAYVKVNGAGSNANAVMERNRAAFIRAATQAGYAADKARELADELLGIKSRNVSVTVTYKVNKSKNVDNTLNRLGGGGLASGGIARAASGGGRGGLTWVGEHGPELLDAPAGSRVRSNSDSRRLLAESNQTSFGVIVAQLIVDGKKMAEQLIDPQREIVSRRYGGDVQATWGRAY